MPDSVVSPITSDPVGADLPAQAGYHLPVTPIPKKFPTLIVLLSLVSILAISFCVFVSLQIRDLKMQIAELPSAPTTSPIPLIDPTTDWEIYINTKYNYQFKHPANLTIRPFAGSQDEPREASMFKLDPEEGETYALISAESNVENPTVGLTQGESINGYDTYYINHPEGLPTDKTPLILLELHSNNQSVQFTFRNMTELDVQAKQLLSTFKFTDDNAPVKDGLSCEYQGKTYTEGESVKVDSCNSCSCSGGQIACTEMACL